MTIDRSRLPDGARFSTVPETAIYDMRISNFEFRVLTALLGRTSDWVVYATQVAKTFGVNEKTIRRALVKLEIYGYATAVRAKKKRVDTHIRPISMQQTPADVGDSFSARRQLSRPVVPDQRTFEDLTNGQLRPNDPDFPVQSLGSECPATYSKAYLSANTGSLLQVTESAAIDPDEFEGFMIEDFVETARQGTEKGKRAIKILDRLRPHWRDPNFY